MQGLLELVTYMPLQSRHCPVGQTPFLVYLLSSSSSFAILRKIVGEMRIFFRSFSKSGASGPPRSWVSTSIPLPWIFISSNERTSHSSSINHEKAFDCSLLRLERNSGERLEGFWHSYVVIESRLSFEVGSFNTLPTEFVKSSDSRCFATTTNKGSQNYR